MLLVHVTQNLLGDMDREYICRDETNVLHITLHLCSGFTKLATPCVPVRYGDSDAPLIKPADKLHEGLLEHTRVVLHVGPPEDAMQCQVLYQCYIRRYLHGA